MLFFLILLSSELGVPLSCTETCRNRNFLYPNPVSSLPTFSKERRKHFPLKPHNNPYNNVLVITMKSGSHIITYNYYLIVLHVLCEKNFPLPRNNQNTYKSAPFHTAKKHTKELLTFTMISPCPEQQLVNVHFDSFKIPVCP